MKFAVKNMKTGIILSDRFETQEEAEYKMTQEEQIAYQINEYEDGMFEVKIIDEVNHE